MKKSIIRVTVLLALVMPSAQIFAADSVQMAGSDDLNEFDRHLSTAQHSTSPAIGHKAGMVKANVATEIKSETAKFKSSAASKAFAKTVKGQSVGYGQGGANSPGATTAATTGAGGDSSAGKGEPGNGIPGKKHHGNSN